MTWQWKPGSTGRLGVKGALQWAVTYTQNMRVWTNNLAGNLVCQIGRSIGVYSSGGKATPQPRRLKIAVHYFLYVLSECLLLWTVWLLQMQTPRAKAVTYNNNHTHIGTHPLIPHPFWPDQSKTACYGPAGPGFCMLFSPTKWSSHSWPTTPNEWLWARKTLLDQGLSVPIARW